MKSVPSGGETPISKLRGFIAGEAATVGAMALLREITAGGNAVFSFDDGATWLEVPETSIAEATQLEGRGARRQPLIGLRLHLPLSADLATALLLAERRLLARLMNKQTLACGCSGADQHAPTTPATRPWMKWSGSRLERCATYDWTIYCVWWAAGGTD